MSYEETQDQLADVVRALVDPRAPREALSYGDPVEVGRGFPW